MSENLEEAIKNHEKALGIQTALDENLLCELKTYGHKMANSDWLFNNKNSEKLYSAYFSKVREWAEQKNLKNDLKEITDKYAGWFLDIDTNAENPIAYIMLPWYTGGKKEIHEKAIVSDAKKEIKELSDQIIDVGTTPDFGWDNFIAAVDLEKNRIIGFSSFLSDFCFSRKDRISSEGHESYIKGERKNARKVLYKDKKGVVAGSFDKIAVDPKYQRKGIGEKLVSLTEKVILQEVEPTSDCDFVLINSSHVSEPGAELLGKKGYLHYPHEGAEEIGGKRFYKLSKPEKVKKGHGEQNFTRDFVVKFFKPKK